MLKPIVTLFLAFTLYAQVPLPNGAGLEPGTLPARWPASGPKCMEQPDWQVHEYNPNFLIVRHSAYQYILRSFAVRGSRVRGHGRREQRISILSDHIRQNIDTYGLA